MIKWGKTSGIGDIRAVEKKVIPFQVPGEL